MSTVLLTFSLVISGSVFIANSQHIVNSTGEYFIASSSNSYKNKNITCNTSNANCYIICESSTAPTDLCTAANIQCGSQNCNIGCTSKSCRNIEIGIFNSPKTSVKCNGESACQSLTFNVFSDVDSTNTSMDITCNGENACADSALTTKQASVNVDCAGKLSCSQQTIISTKLDLLCYKSGAEAVSNCNGSTLVISGTAHYTQLFCNGGQNTNSCGNMQILIPQSYQKEFIDIHFVDNNGSNITAQSGSANNLNINCVNSDGFIAADCTRDEFTNISFPIISDAVPSNTTGNVTVYGSPNAYEYRFKQIQCNDAECVIECLGHQSCSYMYINADKSNVDTKLKCKGSDTHSSNDYSDCYNVAVQSFGNKIDIDCADTDACNKFGVFALDVKVNINCYSTNGNLSTATESCFGLNVSTHNDISLHCVSDKTCKYINLQTVTFGDIALHCQDTRACQNISIDSDGGATLNCTGDYGCYGLKVSLFGGDFNALCDGDHSCTAATFNITAKDVETLHSSFLRCIGVGSCEQMVYGTDLKNVTMECSEKAACLSSQLTTYNPDSSVTLICDEQLSCNEMQILTDGSVDMACNNINSCVTMSITNRTERKINVGKSNIICQCNLGTGQSDACNNLNIVSATHINAVCVSQSNIQSLTGNISANCNGEYSCRQSVFNAFSDVNINCNGSMSCATVGIMGNGDLYLDCSNEGVSNCADINIKLGTARPEAALATNTILCGHNSENNVSDTQCNKLKLDTHATDISIKCHGNGNGGGTCFGSNIISHNYESTIFMQCGGHTTCKSSNIHTENEFGHTTLNCYGYQACSASTITSSSGDIDLSCTDDRACELLNIETRSLTMTCDGNHACEKTQITGKGDLHLDCSYSIYKNKSHTCDSIVIDMDSNADSVPTANTVICGNIVNGTNDTYSYSCVDMQLKSYAEDIKINCYGFGCTNANFEFKEALSRLDMTCEDYNACFNSHIETEGEIFLDCVGNSSCEQMYVESLTDRNDGTVVNCDGGQSCHNLKFSSPVSVLDISCIGEYACESSNWMSLDLQMRCNGEHSCASATVYSLGNTQMHCQSNMSCFDVTVTLPDNYPQLQNGFFGITQDIEGRCDELKFKCGNTIEPFVWDETLKKYQCASMECCPWNPSKPPFVIPNNAISCPIGVDCEIDGTNVSSVPQNPFYPKYDASYVTIDASMATNLEMKCDSTNICEGTNIICPKNIDTIKKSNGEMSQGCNMHCNGQYSCNKANISSMNTNATYIQCATLGSCNNMTVSDVTTELSLHCGGGTGNQNIGSCDGLQILAPTVKTLNVYCKTKLACAQMNINALFGGYVNIVAQSTYYDSNAMTNSVINVGYANRVDINCKGFCSNNTIFANYSSTVNIECDTREFDTVPQYFGGCNSWNVYAEGVKQQINLDLLGKYAASNGVINVSNAKNVRMRMESEVSYDKTDKNDKALVIGPTNMQLLCINYGCYFARFQNKNGLSDIDVEFGGQCNCTEIEDCIDEWDLMCDNGNYNEFVGDKCEGNDGKVCCSPDSVQMIQKSFSNYTRDAKCPNSNGSNGLSTGAIVGIALGSVAFIAAIVLGAWYYKKKKAPDGGYGVIND